ncbi:hypothetical protein QCA50_008431 [Cerrena zonata]|uniref:histone acetyltransferase n=1 Tax=Cerrena zonata TaxID=2478898 RepID=A0AAW0G5D4_9APHY
MPQTFHIDAQHPIGESCIVSYNGTERHAFILERRPREVYVHYADTDKRLDEWISESTIRLLPSTTSNNNTPSALTPDASGSRKRKRGSIERDSIPEGSRASSELRADGGGEGASTSVVITEEEYDIEHHKQITAKRNFDKVIFGRWQIKTWYFSPYPLTETEIEEQVSTPSGSHPGTSTPRIPGVARSSLRSHGRTSDILAGGLGRSHGAGEKSMLWVCDKCFKYMAEGASWELHVKRCSRRHPPGRKVYQRGAHAIWEVDGAKDKLYCQNLSLFGKLFIDIKTLFFDCDNFLFYILTDADSQRDHVLGFFSKEKVSYDDYNLACIVVLPPYQKKGYGMLMIEFSYELSKRAGKIGTPERPLSDLGLRSYLTYWVSSIVRFLRRLLSVLPLDTPKMVSTGSGLEDITLSSSPSRDAVEDGSGLPKVKRKKSVKGWYGEVMKPDLAVRMAQMHEENDPICTTLRTIESTANPDGSSTSHVVVKCTLADIARATGLRVEDTAFAMNECGLLVRKQKVENEHGDGSEEGEGAEGEDEEEMIVISREMVELVAKERNVKKMCMDLAHVLL